MSQARAALTKILTQQRKKFKPALVEAQKKKRWNIVSKQSLKAV